MKSQLPFKISPDPLVNNAIEIRFDTIGNEVGWFSRLLPFYIEEFPNLDTSNLIPQEIKNADPQLKYEPDYQLKNDNYAISFGDNSFLIEILGDYPLWATYFSFIKKQLSKLLSQNVIQTINRVGLRFGNVFEDRTLGDVVIFAPKISLPDYTERLISNRIELKKGDLTLRLQLSDRVKVTKLGRPFSGALVDIDVSSVVPLEPNEKLFDVIDNLHTAEKELFFDVLKPEFLASVNPE